ncbi:MAG TPA: IclR family transcriptional regulator [Xanthobacteraceae bacterium]|nr:IclR family transcriptional regulator [Xanthobacteraceae bacterium]
MPADIATSVRRSRTSASAAGDAASTVARRTRALGKHEKLGAIARSLAIVEHVAKSPAPVGVLDIIDALELPKATAYRLVDWFVSQGYLAREPGRKRLLVGSRLTSLAFGALAASIGNSEPHIVLQRLVNKVNETCNIGTLVNGEVMYLDRIEAKHWPLRLQFSSGSRVPLHCSAIGKLFLAFTPASRRRRLLQHLDLRRYTEQTIVDRASLEAELRQIRKQQVSYDREEYLDGVVCIAVPVLGRNGELLAGVAIQAPQARMDIEGGRAHLPALRATADELAEIFQAVD